MSYDKRSTRPYYKTLTDEELQVRLANAQTTYMMETNTFKAERNGAIVRLILDELEERMVEADDRDGIFNGVGSF